MSNAQFVMESSEVRKPKPFKMSLKDADDLIRSLKRAPVMKSDEETEIDKREMLSMMRPFLIELRDKKSYDAKGIQRLLSRQPNAYSFSIKDIASIIDDTAAAPPFEPPEQTTTEEQHDHTWQ